MHLRKFILKLAVLSVIVCSFSLTSFAEQGGDALSLLNVEEHASYLDSSGGKFRPGDSLTRGEVARMFYSLLTEKGESDEIFIDLWGSDCYIEANLLASLGILNGYEGGYFYPDNLITRAEFAAIFCRFFPDEEKIEVVIPFNDISEDFWGREAVALVSEKGLITGYPDGSFGPEKNVSRAETAVIMNRFLNRNGDEGTIGYEVNIRIFLDVAKDHWAFYDIMEATIGHEFIRNGETEFWTNWNSEATGLSEGLYVHDSELFYVDDIGQLVRSVDVGARRFDWDGKYTTWDEELDAHLTRIIKEVTVDDMEISDKRRAIFEYIRDNYSYLKKPLVTPGTIGWQRDYALAFFNEGEGNCFSFAAGYGLLLRKIGCDVNFIVGTTGTNNAPHGWVEIIVNGETYIDDPELEMSYRKKGNFKINLYNFTYKTKPWPYRK